MDLNKIIEILMYKNILETVLTILVAIIMLRVTKKLFNKNIELIDRKYDAKDNRNKTYVNLISHIVKWAIILTAIIFVLSLNGVNVSSGLASLGIVSIIVGLALQDALKDIIMGFNIISDRYYTIGDSLKIGDVEGKVVDFNLKVTKIKDINTGNTFVISNRNIDRSLVLSTQLDIDIPVKHSVKVEKMEKIIEEIINEAKTNKNIKSIQYVGINDFSGNATIYKIRMKVIPELKPSVKRAVNRIVKLKLEENKIEIPVTQIEIKNGK